MAASLNSIDLVAEDGDSIQATLFERGILISVVQAAWPDDDSASIVLSYEQASELGEWLRSRK